MDYGAQEDYVVNLELDLVSTDVAAGENWGQRSYSGVLLQNESFGLPSFLIDSYGGGDVANPGNHWLSDDGSVFPSALPNPNGQWFYVRHLTDETSSKAKAWHEGDPEPDWQHTQFDATGTRIFDPTGGMYLYVYMEAREGPFTIRIDSIEIVRGYGRSGLLVDNFNRVVAAGNLGEASSRVGTWEQVPGTPEEAALVHVDGENGRFDQAPGFADDVSSTWQLYLPHCIEL
jgi:hypothetical protein